MKKKPVIGIEELVEFWTLLDDEQELVEGRQGATKLGFALLLKFYSRHGRFPRGRSELPRIKRINHIRLYYPEPGGKKTYPNLAPAMYRPIDWDAIETNYDQVIKYVTAIKSGTASTEAILMPTGAA